MGRNNRRVQVELDAGDIKKLSENEIRMILRAADELISVGGRNEVRKVRERISSVQNSLSLKESKPEIRLKKAERENWRDMDFTAGYPDHRDRND